MSVKAIFMVNCLAVGFNAVFQRLFGELQNIVRQLINQLVEFLPFTIHGQ